MLFKKHITSIFFGIMIISCTGQKKTEQSQSKTMHKHTNSLANDLIHRADHVKEFPDSGSEG